MSVHVALCTLMLMVAHKRQTGIMSSSNGGAPPMPNSPFFQPNPRIIKLNGTRSTSVVLKQKLGGESKQIPLDEVEKKSSLLGAYANLCNVCIGAGIVGLPYAIKESGLCAGTIMIVAIAFLTDYSLRQVISTGKLANVNSYETLMEASFGRWGFIFLAMNMFFLSYGSMVAYLIIIKDVLPVLFHVTPHDIDIKRVIMFVSSLLVIVPLSMQRDMADLEKTSRLNVMLNICLVLLVVGFAPIQQSVEAQGGITNMISNETFLDLHTFFVGFGVCSFAFVCQDSSFIIAGSMKTPSKQRWKRVTNGAMLTCGILELTMGLAGYLAYQTNTMGNVLNNMNIYHWSGVISRVMLSTTMFFAYPMNLYIARHAFMVLFFKGSLAHDGDDSIVLMRLDRRVILTWLLYVASLIPAILWESTGKVLSITGAIGGSSIAYIVPGLTFLAIHSNTFIDLIHKRWDGSSEQLWGYPKRSAGEIEAGPRVSHMHALFWYILGMPIWSAIAIIGQSNLAKHFEKQDMASPSVTKPKRITVVKPTWHPPAIHELQLSDPVVEQTALLQLSASHYGARGSMNGGDADNMNENLLNRANSLTPSEITMETKNEVPTWKDFHIAMAYIILGVVAMVMGLVSVLAM